MQAKRAPVANARPVEAEAVNIGLALVDGGMSCRGVC